MNISHRGAAGVGRTGGRLRRRIMEACSGALRRVAANAWPLLQSTAAATAAWWLARWLDNHSDPFFAPIAAVVALNASRGERGANALRLLAGVVVGIVAGELAISALGGGYGTLAVAIFTAMAVAFALGGARVTIAQAASSAILTVAVADGQAGPEPRAGSQHPRAGRYDRRPGHGAWGPGNPEAGGGSRARPRPLGRCQPSAIPSNAYRERRDPDGGHRYRGVRRCRSRPSRRCRSGGLRGPRRARAAADAANTVPHGPSVTPNPMISRSTHQRPAHGTVSRRPALARGPRGASAR